MGTPDATLDRPHGQSVESVVTLQQLHDALARILSAHPDLASARVEAAWKVADTHEIPIAGIVLPDDADPDDRTVTLVAVGGRN